MMGPRAWTVEDFEFDSDVGGTAVNSVVRKLSLSSSRIDATVDPDALTAYSEWTMAFTNASSVEREARAEIALPPGGVVSRLTLWVNGEEREAAFSTRGKMKVRIGITSPLALDDASRAVFHLPRFVERNFGIARGGRHSLFADSRGPIAFASGGSGAEAARTIRASLSDEELTGPESALICSRNARVESVWTPDMIEPGKYAIVQTLASAGLPAPREVVVVIDGSRRMAGAREDIASALSRVPDRMAVAIIQAGEEVVELAPAGSAEKVRRMRCIGGIDNRPALIRACEIALARNNAAILWIHGPQPLESESRSEELLQLCERRAGRINLIAVCAADGRNSILAELEPTGVVTRIPSTGTLSADLGRLFGEWRGESPARLVAQRVRVPIVSAAGVKASSQIARLWARDEVARICRPGDPGAAAEASQLAAQHQIVTPVSGAVVLETEEQYREAGLEPVNPKSVPVVTPEPSSLAALAVGVCLLAAWRRRRA